MSGEPSPEEPEYHPAVEKLIEATGLDKGRVKDENLARTLAEQEEFQREDAVVPVSPEDRIADARYAIRTAVGGQAIRDTQLPESMAAIAINFPDKRMPGSIAADAAGTAREAAASFDQLEKDAQPARKLREEEQQKLRKSLEGDNSLRRDT